MPRVQINYAGTEYQFSSLYTDQQAVAELQSHVTRGRIWSKRAKALAQKTSLSEDDMKLVRFFVYKAESYAGPKQKRLYHRPRGGDAKVWRDNPWGR